MFTLEQCRKIDPELEGLSDEELLQIRDNFYEITQLAFEAWVEKQHGSKNLEWLLSSPEDSLG